MLALQFLVAVVTAFALIELVHRGLVGRDSRYLVAFGQTIAIPGAAIVVFLFAPAYVPFSTWFAVAGVALVLVAMTIRIFSGRRAERRPAEHVWSPADFDRGAQLPIRALEVAGFTTLVFGLEPAFALANVALNALWVLVCLAPPFRETSAENSIHVGAPPAAVWDVMTDPSRGVLTAGEVIEQEVVPPGRIRLGTRLTTVSMVPLMRPWRGQNEIRMRSESEVVGLVEGSSFAVVASDGRSGTERSVVAADHGSFVRMRSWFRPSVPDAIMGSSLVLRQGMPAHDRLAKQMLSRFRNVVEGAG